MITVLRCAVLALFISAGVQAQTASPEQVPAPAVAKTVHPEVKAPVAAKVSVTFPPGAGVMHIPLAQSKRRWKFSPISPPVQTKPRLS